MKRNIILLASLLLAGEMCTAKSLSENWQITGIQPLQPTYLDHVYEYNGWENWFLSIQGGSSFFVGTPKGCEDIFGRAKPMLNVAGGKWITPKFAVRISYQGWKLVDAEIQSREYQNVHADILYNVSSHLWKKDGSLPKWDCAPYIGVGMIRNAYTHKKPFAFTIGIVGRYRIAERFHLSAEIGNTTTFQDFDNHGRSYRFGDNLLHVSAGLTATIGKPGWKRVVDPLPYIQQNDILMDYVYQLHLKFPDIDNMARYERDKIVNIEHSLQKNANREKNNYSGLNSLKARIARANEWRGYQSGRVEPSDSTHTYFTEEEHGAFVDEYLKFIKEGNTCIGAPVFFFFKLNSTVLTETAQIINVEEIAKVMKKYNLTAHVIGAADNQTGLADANHSLSQKRAEYIAGKMVENGVDSTRVIIKGEGGIDTYKPFTANRHSCVILYAK